jgi:mannose-6-phosphate isomerase
MFFEKVKKEIIANQFNIVSLDESRPWGGFFVLDENQAQQFSDTFFDGLDISNLKISGKLSPKILIIKPRKRLSWQYHLRRAEIWRVIEGEVGVIRSFTDQEGELIKYQKGNFIKLNQGERHRLIGLEHYAVVAEIWLHTEKSNPSDEDDIVRVQDDFKRS